MLTSTMVKKKINIYFSHPVVIQPQNVKIKLYLLCLGFIKLYFKKRKFQYKEQFSEQEQVFNFGSTYFSFWEHAPENEIFLSSSKKNFHFGSRLYKFGSMNLSLSLSLYIYICIYTIYIYVYICIYCNSVIETPNVQVFHNCRLDFFVVLL